MARTGSANSAVSCVFLSRSAVSCSSLQKSAPPNALLCRKGKNQRKSETNCEFGSFLSPSSGAMLLEVTGTHLLTARRGCQNGRTCVLASSTSPQSEAHVVLDCERLTWGPGSLVTSSPRPADVFIHFIACENTNHDTANRYSGLAGDHIETKNTRLSKAF